MKVAFNRNIMQYTAGGGDDAFQHDHDYLSPTSVVVEIGGNKGERNIGRNTCCIELYCFNSTAPCSTASCST